MTIAFIFYYFFAIFADAINNKTQKNNILILVCFVLAIMAGIRNPYIWNDSLGYVWAFQNKTSTLFTFSFNDKPTGFTEFGFYLLGVFVRTFTNNYTIYFLFISGLTWLFLYKYYKKYCLLPLMGIAVYLARFYCGRNLMQIRECLAIPIVLLASQYIIDRKFWKFLLYVVIAYQFHHSALFAVPLYFLCWFNFKKKHIYWGLIGAFLLAFLFGGVIKNYISNSEFFLGMARSYVEEDSEKAWGLGLTNPMIYYQSFLLLVFTFFEKRFKHIPDYYFLRTAYFYSTVVLIVLCDYAVLSARLSTVYATIETVIIPAIIWVFNKNERMFPYLVIGIVLSILFYLNYNPLIV